MYIISSPWLKISVFIQLQVLEKWIEIKVLLSESNIFEEKF